MVSLEEAALSRKEKLAALRKRKQEHDNGAGAANGGTADDQDEKQVFRFRNYDPSTGQARKHARVAGPDGEEEDTVEAAVAGMAERVLAEDEARRAQELDLSNIQPKKANWDLRRDLDRKLTKVKPQTEIAVAQLIRQRILAQRGKGGEGVAAELAQALPEDGVEQNALDSDEDI